MHSTDAGGRWHWAWLVGLAVGCSGDGLLTSTGTVSYDGKPLPAGAISFHPVDSRLAPQGGQISAGRFRVRTSPGRYRVEIRASRPKANAPELTPGMKPHELYIPARYNDESVLEAEVSAREPNEFTFELEAARD